MFSNVSPKVAAQAITTIIVGTLVAALGAVTPGMLAALGGFAPVAFAAITALAGYLSGYFITDPVRATGEAAQAVHASIAAATPHAVDAAAKNASFDQILSPADPTPAPTDPTPQIEVTPLPPTA